MSENAVRYKITLKPEEAHEGIKKILVRKDKSLEVYIPPSVKNGSVVKLSGALKITDDRDGDILIEIRVRKRFWAKLIQNFGFWALVMCIPGIFINTEYGGYYAVPNVMFFVIALILGAIQFKRHFSKLAIAGFALGLFGIVFTFALPYYIEIYPQKTSQIYTVTPLGYEGREIGGDNKPIELINNPDAKNPSYNQLKSFIKNDLTDTHPFIHTYFGGYVCADYAEDVHNNAEEAGIRAAWVGIYFKDEELGHALNAFNTTDKGLVFIDCTEWDTVAYVEEGKEYGSIDINWASSLDYSFYEEYYSELSLFEPLGIVESIEIHW